MKTPLINSKKITLDNDPEVRSYIYQVISEFEPYVTPTTQVAVIAKDPILLKEKTEEAGIEVTESELKKLYRISIVLSENGTKIEAEALDYNIFDTIKRAKDILMHRLVAIQNEIVSNKERLLEINHYLQSGITKH